MRTSCLMFLFGMMTELVCGPVAAYTPLFSQSHPISASLYEGATLRLLTGEGSLLSDPVKAVVVSQDGKLLAASPLSASLRLLCEDVDKERQCLAYDDITRTVYHPLERDWQDHGLIDKDGQPLVRPEDILSGFGFTGRPATLGEVVRFETTGLLDSWQTTGIALIWWTTFWVLLLPVTRFIVGRNELSSIGTLVTLLLRTAGALLMIPITAYAWLMAPYSVVYLAFVVVFGAMAAHLMTSLRRRATAGPRNSVSA